MSSNLAYILDTLKDTLSATDDVGSVDDFPVDAEQWAEQVAQNPAGLPALHIAVTDTEVSRYTTGDYIETSEVTVTVLHVGSGSGVSAVAALRDAIISALEADQTIGGYGDSITWIDWEVEAQEETTTRFRLIFSVEHTWEA